MNAQLKRLRNLDVPEKSDCFLIETKAPNSAIDYRQIRVDEERQERAYSRNELEGTYPFPTLGPEAKRLTQEDIERISLAE